MILRLSQKLAKKIKEAPSQSLPPDPNPFADWSAHLFTAERTQFIIVSNTPSLYSAVLYGRGIADGSQLILRALDCLREFMVDDGQEFIYRRFIAPATETVRFSKALNRSITGSMNDLVFHAKMWLIERDLSPYDTSFRLNEIPMSGLDYRSPREAFKALTVGEPASSNEDESSQ
jgi:hypothetical protein